MFSIKQSSACTSTRQAMDRAKTFWMTKGALRNGAFLSNSLPKCELEMIEAEFKRHGLTIQSSLKMGLLKFFARLRPILSNSLRPSIIQQGWIESTMASGNFDLMATTCPAFKGAHPDVQHTVKKNLDIFFKNFFEYPGFGKPYQINEKLFEDLGIPPDMRGNKGNNCTALNQQRASIYQSTDALTCTNSSTL